jgi:DNA-binding NtrC family response regulator
MSVILSSFRERLAAAERDLAIEALKVTDGAITAAARLCGLHKSQLRRIVVRHQLESMLRPASRANTEKHFGNAAWRALAGA